MENTLENKLKKLNIKTPQIEEVKKKTYIAYYREEDTPDEYLKTEVINLADLVGLCRPEAEEFSNWIEVLDSLHKMRNFIIYEKKSFEKILMDPPSFDNPPQVIKIDDKLYIDGEGKHRLTIAKCLGIEKVKVDVKYVTKDTPLSIQI